MKRTLQSATLAVALMFGASATMTIAHSLVAPTAAEAGVLGKIGGAVKSAAKGVGKAAKGVVSVHKTAAKGTIYAGKGIGRGVVGSLGVVKRGYFRVASAASKNRVVRGVAKVGVKISGR